MSDPAGRCTIESAIPLTRYQFGLGVTDFLLCSVCGCYLAAVMADGDGWRSTVNINCFDDPLADLPAEPVVYDSEGSGDRIARRLSKWTPTVINEPEPADPASA